MVRCGVIGCGVIAPTHIEGYQAIPEVQVVHLCDLSPERMKRLGSKYGIERQCTNYHQLLRDPEVDLVSVCTDHASHAKIVVDALKAGKHVVCEKSIGRVPGDLKRMCAVAKAHPELVASGIFQHRFQPANRRLKELIATDAFGKIIAVNLIFNCLRTAEYYQKDNWRGTQAGEGGGVLINQAIHYLDQLRFLFGEVRRVNALTKNLTHQGVIEVEDTAVFMIEFESGIFGTVAATNSAAVEWRGLLSISGTKVCLEYTNEVPTHVEGSDTKLVKKIESALSIKNDTPVVGKKYYGVGHTDQLADVIEAIRMHRAPAVTIADAAGSSALVMAVYKSATRGGWVDVPSYY